MSSKIRFAYPEITIPDHQINHSLLFERIGVLQGLSECPKSKDEPELEYMWQYLCGNPAQKGAENSVEIKFGQVVINFNHGRIMYTEQRLRLVLAIIAPYMKCQSRVQSFIITSEVTNYKIKKRIQIDLCNPLNIAK